MNMIFAHANIIFIYRKFDDNRGLNCAVAAAYYIAHVYPLLRAFQSVERGVKHGADTNMFDTAASLEILHQ